MFVKRCFVSHYLNVPYHKLLDASIYSATLIEELYEASFYLVRNFELSPYSSNDSIEDKIQTRIDNGDL